MIIFSQEQQKRIEETFRLKHTIAEQKADLTASANDATKSLQAYLAETTQGIESKKDKKELNKVLSKAYKDFVALASEPEDQSSVDGYNLASSIHESAEE